MARPRVHLHSSLSPADARNWSYFSDIPTAVLACDSESLVTRLLSARGEVRQQWSDPLAALAWMATHPGDTLESRWIGYLSYDLGRLFERLPVLSVNDLKLPLFHFSLHEKQTRSDVPARINGPSPPGIILSRVDQSEYLNSVRRAIDYIQAGDIFQVNLSQRFTVQTSLKAQQVWHKLVSNSPPAYGAYLELDDLQIICNSPELFVHLSSDRKVTTRPIKGTRPAGSGNDEELLHSIKDQAELNMIVDLERNDLGRICEIGSVRVSQHRTIESHPTLFHGVAAVEGRVRTDVTFVDLLRATFPGGSITGAPKVRAMQIIEELEPVRRGPYCGAIGYLAADGSLQFNVAIRTAVIRNGQAYLSVGGGIVADSDPLQEYRETLVKASALFSALNVNI